MCINSKLTNSQYISDTQFIKNDYVTGTFRAWKYMKVCILFIVFENILKEAKNINLTIGNVPEIDVSTIYMDRPGIERDELQIYISTNNLVLDAIDKRYINYITNLDFSIVYICK